MKMTFQPKKRSRAKEMCIRDRGMPALWLIPTGIPRPSSITVIELSGLMETSTLLQCPASASSTALSTICLLYTSRCV